MLTVPAINNEKTYYLLKILDQVQKGGMHAPLESQRNLLDLLYMLLENQVFEVFGEELEITETDKTE